MKLFLAYLVFFIVNAQNMSAAEVGGRESNQRPKMDSYGTIKGVVIDKKTHKFIPGVNITIGDTRKGTSTNQNGEFRISKVEPGEYFLVFDHIAYARQTIENIQVSADDTADMGTVELIEEPVVLKELVVSPGSYSIMASEHSVRQTLSGEDIKMMGWAEDITRAVQRLPGISGNDFTAKFNIWGGEEDEVLVLLDGMQIYEPFHQKDFKGGLFSSIDIETIGGLNLLTGGYTAQYGDKMSGIMDMKTKNPEPGESQNSIGLSIMNLHGFSMGSFAGNKGSWLVSGRRGYLDIINRLMNNEFKLHPNYYDIMGKVSYKIHKNHTLSTHAFITKDSYLFDENVIEKGKTVPNIDFLDTRYGNNYGWITLDSFFRPDMHARSIIYGGVLTQNRDRRLFDDDPEEHFTSDSVNDDRRFELLGFKQDWSYETTENLFLGFGLDIKGLSTEYTYSKTVDNEFITSDYILTKQTEKLNVQRSVTGTQLGLYLSSRVNIFDPLTVETGLRYDYASYSGDQLWSPRISAVYSLSRTTFLRAGWGYYYQPQTINELKIEFGETEYHAAELSKHTVLGIEHHFNNGVQLRAEAYLKKISRLADRYVTFRNIDEFFPETRNDLIKLVVDDATAKGIELYAKYDTGKKVSLWASYILSSAADQVSELHYAGPLLPHTGSVPRPWDQRHTLNIDVNYRPLQLWHFNFSWQYRSGWPYTPFEVKRIVRDDETFAYYKDYGVYNSKTYPAYHRLDVRINKYFNTSKGRITAFLHVINVLNHENVNNYDFGILEEDVTGFRAEVDAETWFGILPLIGVSWEF